MIIQWQPAKKTDSSPSLKMMAIRRVSKVNDCVHV